ncbi:MAG: LysR family transcriptional regulator [Rhodospirillaceae bacterium]|nr:LysR family transcriptional regulator [Rhodospirillaceae bacterium]
MRYTLKQLAYFVATAEAGSITAAARALHISQPSISAAIAQLEATFGLELFIRHHAQGLGLTPTGQRLLAEARSLLAQARDFHDGAIELAEGVAGEIDVGCFITFAPMVIPGLLRAMRQEHPEIRVRLHELHIEGLLEGLREGRFDLALTYDLNIAADMTFEPLADVQLHVMLAADHPFADRNAIALRDLIDEPFVLLALPGSRDYFLSLFYGLSLQPQVAHESPSFEMVRGLVANGYGYSVMHSRPVNDIALDGMRLVYRPVADPLRPTRLGLLRRSDLRERRIAGLFAALCRNWFDPRAPFDGDV